MAYDEEGSVVKVVIDAGGEELNVTRGVLVLKWCRHYHRLCALLWTFFFIKVGREVHSILLDFDALESSIEWISG